MAEIDNNAAFPFVSMGGIGEHQYIQFGSTKRELFAAMAMLGVLANNSRMGSRLEVAEYAVMQADALIAELAKNTSPTGVEETP